MALTKVSRGLLNTSIVDNGNDMAITIDGSENVIVGKDSTTFSTAGSYLASGGNAYFTSSNNQLLALNRLSTEGSWIEFYKDTTTTVGSIGSKDNNLIIGTGDTGLRFSSGTDSVFPISTSTGNGRDAAVDLGLGSGGRFKDIYLSGGVNFSANANAAGMSSELLDDYEYGSWSPTAAGINASGYGVETAEYTKVGRLVTCDLRVTWTSSANNTSAVTFSLPFPSQGNSAGASTARTGLVFYSGTQLFSGAAVSTHIPRGASFASFYKTSGGSFQQLTANMVNGSYNWLVSFSYFAA